MSYFAIRTSKVNVGDLIAEDGYPEVLEVMKIDRKGYYAAEVGTQTRSGIELHETRRSKTFIPFSQPVFLFVNKLTKNDISGN